jgi:hypothetical protein
MRLRSLLKAVLSIITFSTILMFLGELLTEDSWLHGRQELLGQISIRRQLISVFTAILLYIVGAIAEGQTDQSYRTNWSQFDYSENKKQYKLYFFKKGIVRTSGFLIITLFLSNYENAFALASLVSRYSSGILIFFAFCAVIVFFGPILKEFFKI